MFRPYLTRYVAELTCLISHKFNLLNRKMLLLADTYPREIQQWMYFSLGNMFYPKV